MKLHSRTKIAFGTILLGALLSGLVYVFELYYRKTHAIQRAYEEERARQAARARTAVILDVAGRLEDQMQERVSTPYNLDLAIRRGRDTLYLNSGYYSTLYKPEDEKLGLVITTNDQRFLLALEDLNGGEDLNWITAKRLFGTQLPTKEQGAAIACQYSAVNEALTFYGATPLNRPSSDMDNLHPYWTRTADGSSAAWLFSSMLLKVNTDSIYAQQARVRAVFPLPEN